MKSAPVQKIMFKLAKKRPIEVKNPEVIKTINLMCLHHISYTDSVAHSCLEHLMKEYLSESFVLQLSVFCIVNRIKLWPEGFRAFCNFRGVTVENQLIYEIHRILNDEQTKKSHATVISHIHTRETFVDQEKLFANEVHTYNSVAVIRLIVLLQQVHKIHMVLKAADHIFCK